MRWNLKIYPVTREQEDNRFRTTNYSGAKMAYISMNGYNFLVYGEDAHEMFYEKYDNEEYHEFCYVTPKYGAE